MITNDDDTSIDMPDIHHPTNTFSDDDEYDNDSSSNDNDDIEHDIEHSLEANAVPFWKQHLPAILIAVLATIISHYCLLNKQNNIKGNDIVNTYLQPIENSNEKHNHLYGFQRTTYISFCRQQSRTTDDRHHHHGQLQTMDFYLSKDLFLTFQSFYLLDQMNMDSDDNNNDDDDDDSDDSEITYSDVDILLSNNQDTSTVSIVDPEYHCLVEQYHNKNQNKIIGTTNYYLNPTLEQIYPELATNIDLINDDDDTRTAVVTSSSRQLLSKEDRKRKLQQPPLEFTGFAAKFVNMSPKSIKLFWDGKGGHDESKRLVGEILPFESIGTATTPGQSFHVTPAYDTTTALQRWVVTADTALIYYEPHSVKEIQQQLLGDVNDKDSILVYNKYQRQRINQEFARDYLVATGRTWLSQFPRRFPLHYMHKATHIGQTISIPASNIQLQVVSVTPKVYMIENFLSQQECNEIIRLSIEKGLKQSTVHTSTIAKSTNDTMTRSSSNTWLPRDTNQLTEQVYVKAAQLLNIDSGLFQKFHETSAQHHSIAESLQIVRYRKNEEYTPHHDFVTPPINDRYQATRVATLLLYLNTIDVGDGGETRFPRAINNYNARGIEIQPKMGTAVLFYNMLEDGNVDDLSQHGSNKVLGNTNKWIANLWVWDPVIG